MGAPVLGPEQRGGQCRIRAPSGGIWVLPGWKPTRPESARLTLPLARSPGAPCSSQDLFPCTGLEAPAGRGTRALPGSVSPWAGLRSPKPMSLPLASMGGGFAVPFLSSLPAPFPHNTPAGRGQLLRVQEPKAWDGDGRKANALSPWAGLSRGAPAPQPGIRAGAGIPVRTGRGWREPGRGAGNPSLRCQRLRGGTSSSHREKGAWGGTGPGTMGREPQHQAPGKPRGHYIRAQSHLQGRGGGLSRAPGRRGGEAGSALALVPCVPSPPSTPQERCTRLRQQEGQEQPQPMWQSGERAPRGIPRDPNRAFIAPQQSSPQSTGEAAVGLVPRSQGLSTTGRDEPRATELGWAGPGPHSRSPQAPLPSCQPRELMHGACTDTTTS